MNLPDGFEQIKKNLQYAMNLPDGFEQKEKMLHTVGLLPDAFEQKKTHIYIYAIYLPNCLSNIKKYDMHIF